MCEDLESLVCEDLERVLLCVKNWKQVLAVGVFVLVLSGLIAKMCWKFRLPLVDLGCREMFNCIFRLSQYD